VGCDLGDDGKEMLGLRGMWVGRGRMGWEGEEGWK